jgi:hypothetical protein
MAVDTGAAPSEATDDLQSEVDRLKAKLSAEISSREKLEAKRNELLTEAKRNKRLTRLIEVAGLTSDDDEEVEVKIAELLARSGQGSTDAKADDKADSAKPDSVADPLLKSEIAKLTRQLEAVQRKAEEAERREQEALKRQQDDKIERMVVDHLAKSGCRRPAHVFKLKKGEFHLSDDGVTVLCGPDYDPKTLSDFSEALKEDDEFDIYFAGSGATGSGVGTRGSQAGAASGVHTGRNPFSTDALNRTEAARLFQKEPEKAKRLMAEARAAGKLDSSLAKFLA